jgi:arylsulfatase A-like enzyme
MGKGELIGEYSSRPGVNGQSNAVYAAMIKSVDESVRRVLEKLDELKLSKKTIVIFTSDNGGAVHFGKPPATSNAPLRMGKGYAYEGGLRVPLLIKVPWITRNGSVSGAPVISQDFFPTLLELVGADKSAGRSATDGVSLVPLLKGQTTLPERQLFWHYPHYWNRKGDSPVTPYSVVRSGNWKLIRFYESGRDELYNLSDDLREQHDLAASETRKANELSDRLKVWLKEVNAQMPVAR